MNKKIAFAVTAVAFVAISASPPATYSVLISGGTIYDGSGGTPYVGDVALKGDKIVYVGPHAPGRAARLIHRKPTACRLVRMVCTAAHQE